MRNAALVDGWKYGHGPRWERRWFSLVFHGWKIGHRLCSESTGCGGLWRSGASGASQDLAAAYSEDGEAGEDDGQCGEQNFGYGEGRVGVVR